MTRRMVRCVQGHPFDASASEVCPICAAREARAGGASIGQATGDQKLDPTPPLPTPLYKNPVVIIAGVVGLAVAAYAVLPNSAPQEERKQASSAPEPTRIVPAPIPVPEAVPSPPTAIVPPPLPPPPAKPSQQSSLNPDKTFYTQRLLIGLAQNSTDIEPPWLTRRDPPDQWAIGSLDESSSKALNAARPTADATKALMLYLSGLVALSKSDFATAGIRFEVGYYFGCAICAYSLATNQIYNPAFANRRDRAMIWMAIAERIGIADAAYHMAFLPPRITETKFMRGQTPPGGIKVGGKPPQDSFLLAYAWRSHLATQNVDLARRGDKTAQSTLKRIGVSLEELPETTWELGNRIVRTGNGVMKDDLTMFVDRAAGGDALALFVLAKKLIPNPAVDFDLDMQILLAQAAALRGKDEAMIGMAELISATGRSEVNTPGGIMGRVDQAIFAFAGLVLANSANKKPIGAAIEPYLAKLEPAQRSALEPYFKSVTPTFGKHW